MTSTVRTTLTSGLRRLTGAASEQARQYASGDDRPVGGYVGAMATYASLVAGLAAAARLSRRSVPDRLTGRDIAVLAAATHKLSRLLAKDPVTSPLRVPFTRFEGTTGPSELKESSRGSGGRQTVGELVTCPFCTSVWVATGFTAGLVFVPRTTRLAAGTLAVLASADMLHFIRSLLEQAAES